MTALLHNLRKRTFTRLRGLWTKAVHTHARARTAPDANRTRRTRADAAETRCERTSGRAGGRTWVGCTDERESQTRAHDSGQTVRTPTVPHTSKRELMAYLKVRASNQTSKRMRLNDYNGRAGGAVTPPSPETQHAITATTPCMQLKRLYEGASLNRMPGG